MHTFVRILGNSNIWIFTLKNAVEVVKSVKNLKFGAKNQIENPWLSAFWIQNQIILLEFMYKIWLFASVFAPIMM